MAEGQAYKRSLAITALNRLAELLCANEKHTYAAKIDCRRVHLYYAFSICCAELCRAMATRPESPPRLNDFCCMSFLGFGILCYEALCVAQNFDVDFLTPTCIGIRWTYAVSFPLCLNDSK